MFFFKMFFIFFFSSLIGHSATLFLACFTSDSSFVVTGCHDGVLKLWSNDLINVDFNNVENQNVESQNVEHQKALSTIRDAHDLGITCGECSPVISKYSSYFNFYLNQCNRALLILNCGKDERILTPRLTVESPPP